MARLLQIASPDAARAGVGFDTPLAMLLECHRRVEAQCDTLARLVPHLRAAGSDAAAAEAAQAVMRYFDLAAPLHHADEEQDLFPALLAAAEAAGEVAPVRRAIEALQGEHRAFESLWLALRAVLERVVAVQPAQLDPQAVDAFRAAYAAHIAREEGEVLPMAARLLADGTQARIGRAMRIRRGARD